MTLDFDVWECLRLMALSWIAIGLLSLFAIRAMVDRSFRATEDDYLEDSTLHRETYRER